MFSGNCTVLRYSFSNLVIASIGAVTTLEVAVPLPGALPGDVGIAIPRDGAFTSGIAINPIRVTAADAGVIPFVNGSAGAIDPADTFDFDVYLFRATGEASN